MIKEMNIQSAQYRNDENGNPASVQAVIDGSTMSVPLDLGNRHYAEIMRQVEAGELTIEPDPGPTEEQIAAQVRGERDRLIAETDHLVMPDYPLTDSERTAIADYRQALRDVPQQTGFPTDVDWPTKP